MSVYVIPKEMQQKENKTYATYCKYDYFSADDTIKHRLKKQFTLGLESQPRQHFSASPFEDTDSPLGYSSLLVSQH